MYSILKNFLSKYKNKTVSLSQLEALAPGDVSYEEFVRAIKNLEQEKVLQPVKAQGLVVIGANVANAFRIQKANLHKDLHEKIRSKQREIHRLIDLGSYFLLPAEMWEADRENIANLDKYLSEKGLPKHPAPAPERSYEIAGDEKWLQDGGGEAFLQRVGLHLPMKVTPVPEPLMLSINPGTINNPAHHHLIVENKTTYHALAPLLAESPYTTLIYGAGKGFLNSIIYLERQINLPDCQHLLQYFGDLDLEGIKIWFMLNRVRPTSLAMIFYRALLDRTYRQGKQNHRKDEQALAAFKGFFTMAEQQQIDALFANGGYYPQEALSTDELRSIWRKSWMSF